MPFPRPTLTQLRNQIWADMQTQAGNLLPVSVLWCLAWAQAGIASLHYAFLDRIAQEATPWGATAERMLAWAALKGIAPLPASYAVGTWTGTGTASLPSGTGITRGDGFGYATTAIGTPDGSGNINVAIVATAAGAAGNAASGTALTLSNGIPGVNAAGLAGTAITGGADAETESATRTRMLAAYASPPQGGSMADYLEWALAVPGVTRAWIRPLGAGDGTVNVYTMFDEAESANNGFPQGAGGVATLESRGTPATGDLLTVANAIYQLRPVTALVYSIAPTAYQINVTIANLYPNTSAMQAAVGAALAAALLRVASVGGSSWPVGSEGIVNGNIFPSDLTDALSAVPGLVRFSLVSPAGVTSVSNGVLPVLGPVTFV